MKVLNFGSLNIDMVYHLPHIVVPGETLASSDMTMHAGGKGANQSAALSKAGVDIYHAGKTGEDGRWLIDKLKSYGVNTDFIFIGENMTGHAIIQLSDKGENSIVLFGGENRNITDDEINNVFISFSEGDILLLQNEINNIKKIMEYGRKKGMKICFNPAPFGIEILDYPLDLVDIFIINETEGFGLTGGIKEPDRIVDNLTGKYPDSEIILTLGENGVLYGKGKVRNKAESFKVRAVDTTAAGDTFTGYYISEMIKGRTVEEALETACFASSLTVSRLGAMESIPNAEELMK